MSEPIYKKHLEWAKKHRDDNRIAEQFCSLAWMYSRSQDAATYGLIQAVAADVEKAWKVEEE